MKAVKECAADGSEDGFPAEQSKERINKGVFDVVDGRLRFCDMLERNDLNGRFCCRLRNDENQVCPGGEGGPSRVA